MLGVNEGNWGPAPVSFSYQWQRNGVAIPGAINATFRLTPADAGSYISVRVTGSKAGYASVSQSTIAIGPIWFPAWARPGSAVRAV